MFLCFVVIVIVIVIVIVFYLFLIEKLEKVLSIWNYCNWIFKGHKIVAEILISIMDSNLSIFFVLYWKLKLYWLKEQGKPWNPKHNKLMFVTFPTWKQGFLEHITQLNNCFYFDIELIIDSWKRPNSLATRLNLVFLATRTCRHISCLMMMIDSLAWYK